jgi:hypothetical protein
VFEKRVLRRIFGPKMDEVAGEHCITRSFVIVDFTKYYYGDQIKEDEMGASSTDVRDEKSI